MREDAITFFSGSEVGKAVEKKSEDLYFEEFKTAGKVISIKAAGKIKSPYLEVTVSGKRGDKVFAWRIDGCKLRSGECFVSYGSDMRTLDALVDILSFKKKGRLKSLYSEGENV